jgi:hypothetical protein
MVHTQASYHHKVQQLFLYITWEVLVVRALAAIAFNGNPRLKSTTQS